MNASDQIRRLTAALFFSGSLNIFLLSVMLYGAIRERPPAPYYELKPIAKKAQERPLALDPTNTEILRAFRKLPLEQLLAKLAHAQPVENGYTIRDLALASLVAFHQFDLARALSSPDLPEQCRKILIGRHQDGSPAEMVIFPGLSDVQFQTIISFANRETWPLTSKGLFVKIKRNYQKGGPMEASLVETFYATHEFCLVERLFNRSQAPILKEEVLKVISEGTWVMLNTFVQQQRLQQDLSPLRRQRFLLHYIEQGSPSAAYLLLKTDGDFAARKLPDHQVLAILQLMTQRTPEAKQFAITQLMSPRCDEVWKMAAHRLYQFEGEALPEHFQRQMALARFVQKPTHLVAAESLTVFPLAHTPLKPPPSMPARRLYIVQPGDSLWKISRRFKVDMQEIKKMNQLENDCLRPGTTLRIP
jgi:LysM repeat protein